MEIFNKELDDLTELARSLPRGDLKYVIRHIVASGQGRRKKIDRIRVNGQFTKTLQESELASFFLTKGATSVLVAGVELVYTPGLTSSFLIEPDNA